MRVLHIVIAISLLAVFLRPDTQLKDIVLKADMIWSGGAALLLIGILLGRFSARWPTPKNTLKMAGLGLIVVPLLGLVEYSVEWRRSLTLAQNQTVVLSAAAVESVSSYIVQARDGLFRTKALVNGTSVEMLIDTGATVVLLTYETAQKIGIDVAKLDFSEPVISAAGALEIANITLDHLSIGDISLNNVQAAVSPKGQSHSNLLGASFLSRLDGAVFTGDQVVLRKVLR
ncbi:MAG: TIGR02281 family clan AA aspartic protease [Rhodobacteraceae bacterium]|nr:TIGR02281 family clan AA aspartic protease [Paracoccaceae bacterium]